MPKSPLMETLDRMGAIITTHTRLTMSESRNIASEVLETLAVKGYLTDIQAQRPGKNIMEATMRTTLHNAGIQLGAVTTIVPKLYNVLQDMGKA